MKRGKNILILEDEELLREELKRLVEKSEPDCMVLETGDIKEAYQYYQNKKEFDKANNLQSMISDVVTMYRLKNKLNYFYSILPYDTSVINRFELVFLGRNRIVLVCPNMVSK